MTNQRVGAHLSLNHMRSAFPHLVHSVEDVDREIFDPILVVVKHLHYFVHRYESPAPADASATRVKLLVLEWVQAMVSTCNGLESERRSTRLLFGR